MDALHQAENYLVARGCDIHKIKDHLIEFRLPGETSRTPGGRLSLARDGTLTMWHRYAEKGLAAIGLGLPPVISRLETNRPRRFGRMSTS
jgi:hypothetical protein